jgi:hypothetical protein
LRILKLIYPPTSVLQKDWLLLLLWSSSALCWTFTSPVSAVL